MPTIDRWNTVRRLLEVPDLRRLLIAFLVFTVSEWATWIALLVYAHGVGGAETAGVAAVAMLIPAAVLSPPLSRLIDRYPRRSGLIISYGAQGLLALACGAAMLAGAPVAAILTVAALQMVVVSIGRVAHGSAIPVMSSSPHEALAANAATGSLDGIGALIGPLAAAGLLLSGPGALFVVMGVFLAGCAVLLTATESSRSTDRPPMAIDHDRDSGVASLTLPDVAAVITIGGLSQIVVGALDILLVVLAIDVLDLGEPGAGLLNSLFGIGSIVAGIAAFGLVGRPRLGRAIGAGSVGIGAPLILAAPIPLATLLFPLTGFSRTYGDVAGRTLLHRLAPDESMGRTFGVLEGLSMAGLAVGAGSTPLLINTFGVTTTLIAVGAIMPVGALALGPLLRRADRNARIPSEALDALSRVTEFSLLDPVRLERLALDSSIEPTAIDDVIMRDGEIGTAAWVVVTGRFRVSHRGRTVAELGAGEIVGELALLHTEIRTADVVSLEPGTLLRLDRQSFLDVVATGATDSHHLRQLAARRIRELDELAD